MVTTEGSPGSVGAAPGNDPAASADGVTHVDVLIVGAGISGIGAAYHLRTRRPESSVLVLENQASFGGTWRTHRYPGIRSDSDLYTFGYRFKPWVGTPIASGPEIMKYLGEVIEENGLDELIRYDQQVEAASWSSEDRCWTLAVTDTSTGTSHTFTSRFLWMCQGYYNHREPYTPRWDGMEDFTGEIVHPQLWPDDLDHAGKRVVVIGSGATAATLIPAMADDAAHVTMLQRSPTYFAARANVNELADELRSLEVPEEWVHEIVRRKILKESHEIAEASRHFPEMVTKELLGTAREILGDDFDLDTHFTPRYRPWQQRLALIPDGDLFHAIADGKASVVTDEIDRFTPSGIRTRSGEVLEADIIITATGFDLCVLGDVAFSIDGEPLVFSETVTWNGAMFTGVPNMLWVFGYFRASWTLRVDLLADLVIRLLGHMDELGATVVTPQLREADADLELLPWVDPENFNPGYLMRSMHLLPKQGATDPWRHTQDYQHDKVALPEADLDDGSLQYR